jgi:hypothetical protein
MFISRSAAPIHAALIAARRYPVKSLLVAAFLLCALPTGLMMALLTPPGQVPDEPNHFARAVGLMHGSVLIIHASHISAATGKLHFDPAIKITTGLEAAAIGHTTVVNGVHQVFQSDWWTMTHSPQTTTVMHAFIPNTATYFPAAYLPAALGVAAALAAHATPMVCFLTARLFMLAAYLALGMLALSLAETGGAYLLAILLIPMALFLAGSVSEDGVLVAIACVATAAATGPVTPRRRVISLVALGLFLAAKPPYLPLLLLLLLPRFGGTFARRCAMACNVAAPVLLWLALVLRYTAVPFYKPPYHPGPLWAGDPTMTFEQTDSSENLHILLAHPARFLSLPWHFWASNLVLQLHEMIGTLGLLQITLPFPYLVAWGAALALTFAAAIPRRATAADALPALAVPAILLLAIWGVTISLYLNWTGIGFDQIDGMQGRYLLPLLPFALLAMPPGRAQPIASLIATIPITFLGLFGLAYLPLTFVAFFYLH